MGRFTAAVLTLLVLTFAACLNVQYAGAEPDKIDFYYFIHVTDMHIGSGSADLSAIAKFSEQVKDVFAKLPFKPLAIVDTGDVADDPSYAEYAYGLYKSYMDFSSYGIPTFVTPGNHDVKGVGDSKFREWFGDPTAKFDVWVNKTHYIRFISIETARPDSPNGVARGSDLDKVESWVRACESDRACLAVYVFGHHPPAPNTDELYDYKVTPFNTIVSGDPWRLVRIIESHRKVIAYLYGHVHVNWVTYSSHGKAYIGTAPLTLEGPWGHVLRGEPYDGIGKVYRVVAWFGGRLYTAVYRVGSWPIALVLGVWEGDVVSGVIRVFVLAASDSPIKSVEVYVDDRCVASAKPFKTSEVGGLYVAYIDTDSMQYGQHVLDVRVEDSSGRVYWSKPRIYFFVRVSGGLLFARAKTAAIAFGVREDVPVARLYVFSEGTVPMPFAAVYLRAKAPLDTKVLVSAEEPGYNTRLRLGIFTASTNPSPSDALSTSLSLIKKFVCGVAVESNGEVPYGVNAWRPGGEWGEYTHFYDMYPHHFYWLQVSAASDGFTAYCWELGREFGDAAKASLGYSDKYHDADDIRYVVFVVRTDTGYYSEAAIAFIGVYGKYRTEIDLVPNSLGIPTALQISNVTVIEEEEGAYKVEVVISAWTLDGSPAKNIVVNIQVSHDRISWHTVTKASTDSRGVAKVTFYTRSKDLYVRAMYMSQNTLYSVTTTTTYATAASKPVKLPEPVKPITETPQQQQQTNETTHKEEVSESRPETGFDTTLAIIAVIVIVLTATTLLLKLRK